MAPFAVAAVILLLCNIKNSLASTVVKPLPDGFSLEDLEPDKYFSYGVVPQRLNQETTLSFYDVDISSTSCEELSVEVQSDGYFKHDFYRLATLCDADSISKYTVSSSQGFHIIIRTGDKFPAGSLKAKIESDSGLRVTNQILYG